MHGDAQHIKWAWQGARSPSQYTRQGSFRCPSQPAPPPTAEVVPGWTGQRSARRRPNTLQTLTAVALVAVALVAVALTAVALVAVALVASLCSGGEAMGSRYRRLYGSKPAMHEEREDDRQALTAVVHDHRDAAAKATYAPKAAQQTTSSHAQSAGGPLGSKKISRGGRTICGSLAEEAFPELGPSPSRPASPTCHLQQPTVLALLR